MKVYDCFPFFNEVELLRLRLCELDPVVDQFIVVQATTTFRGNDKPVIQLQDDARLAPFAHKLRHILVTDLPRGTTPWFAEILQRNKLNQVLTEAQPDDLVMLSDLDEIPSRKAVKDAQIVGQGQVAAFDMRFFYYGLNWERPNGWDYARAVRAAALTYLSPTELRRCPPDITIPDAGWHLSYFYPRRELVREIQTKAVSFSHGEYATADYLAPSYLEFCLRGGLSWCTTPKYVHKLRFRELDSTYPEEVLERSASWSEYCVAPDERDRVAEGKADLLNILARIWYKAPNSVKDLVPRRRDRSN